MHLFNGSKSRLTSTEQPRPETWERYPRQDPEGHTRDRDPRQNPGLTSNQTPKGPGPKAKPSARGPKSVERPFQGHHGGSLSHYVHYLEYEGQGTSQGAVTHATGPQIGGLAIPGHPLGSLLLLTYTQGMPMRHNYGIEPGWSWASRNSFFTVQSGTRAPHPR